MDVGPQQLAMSGHWLGLEQGDLLIPRCLKCEHWNPLTSRLCVLCGSEELSWKRPSGRGTVRLLRPTQGFSGDLRDAFVDLVEGPVVLASVRWTDICSVGADAMFRFAGTTEGARPLFVPESDDPAHA